ncbi:MAG TPA: glycine betaine ABC transporter substrate-binding protein, partial [bacterium]
WNLWWFPSLGFENSYEIAVPRSLAEEHDLKTIGDLAPISPDLKARLGFEFIDRPDGLPLLAETYDLNFGEVIGMQQILKLVAVESGDIDVLDVYTTDGTIIKYNLVVLEDDKDMFPPYEAAPLVNGNTFERYPEIYPALSMLEGALSPDMMRRLNRRLQEDKEPVERVAQDALEELGLVDAIQVDAISTSEHTLISYMAAEKAKLIRLTLNHLFMAAVAVLLGVLIAVPLGLLLERWRPGAEPVIRTIGLAQTIPSIALLAFMIPPFGIGIRPAIIALWIYSLFPILRSTFSGIRDADPQAVAAAHALGMTPAQILTQIRLPLAAPVIMAGVRTAAIITVGTATLAAFIGAGGLGEPIVTGLQTYDVIMILSGAIPAAVLAIVVDLILGGVEILVKPKGMVKSEY